MTFTTKLATALMKLESRFALPPPGQAPNPNPLYYVRPLGGEYDPTPSGEDVESGENPADPDLVRQDAGRVGPNEAPGQSLIRDRNTVRTRMSEKKTPAEPRDRTGS